MKAKRLAKTLGLVDVFCISTGAMISSGIFILPGIAYAQIGPAVFLSYFLGGMCALVGTLATIELATAMPLAGGIYYYTERSLGPLAGTISGILNWAAIALKTAFAIYGLSIMMVQFSGGQIPFLWWACGITAFFLVVNLIGTKEAAWAQIFMVILLLAVMFGYIGGLVPEIEGARFKPFLFEGKNISDIVYVAAFVFVAFGGLLDVASVSEEVKNPRRNLPWGMITAIAMVTLIYTGVLIATIGAVPGPELAKSSTPLADAARHYFGEWGFWALNFGAIMAFVTTANAGIMAAARFPLALSRDKLIPSVFSRVYGKKALPLPALLLTGTAIVVALFLNLEKLVQAASTVIMLSFVLTNLSVIILRESELQNYRPSFRVPWYPLVPLVGMLAFSYLIVQMGLESVQISLAIIAFAVLLYFVFGRKVNLEFALMHLLGRLSRNRVDSHGLESELREIVRSRDGIVKDEFDEEVEAALAEVIKEELTRDEVFEQAARKIAPELGLDAAELVEQLRRREAESGTAITRMVAVPHVTVPGENIFQLMLVKCVKPVAFSENEDPTIRAIVFLFASSDRRNLHLRSLAAIAQTIQSPNFERRWLRARTSAQLRDIFLLGRRRRESGRKP